RAPAPVRCWARRRRRADCPRRATGIFRRSCADNARAPGDVAFPVRFLAMTSPLSPAIVKGSGRKELPAYLSNGVVGLRVRENPLAAGMALLCGFSGLHPVKKI